MDLFIKVDSGTDTEHRYIVNPLFNYLVDSWFAQGREIYKMFGFGIERRE